MSKKKNPDDREIWDKAVSVAVREPVPEITDHRSAIRQALKESRMRHTVRVTSKLP